MLIIVDVKASFNKHYGMHLMIMMKSTATKTCIEIEFVPLIHNVLS